MTTDEQRGLILGILIDFACEDIAAYLDHVGFDVLAIKTTKELPAAYLGHYRLGQGTYDVERALVDFKTWPPISRRIFELQEQQVKG